jgi:selenocysteine lyase/cysteine desulfurase
MASVCLPEGAVEAATQHSGSLNAYLTEAHRFEIPIIPWGAGLGTMLRYSVHLYNEYSEYERLADAIVALRS